MASIQEMARVEPHRQAQMTYRYLEVGAVIRGAVKRAFMDIEKHGGRVTFQNEYRGWFETTFTHVKIEGPAYLLAPVENYFRSLGKD